MKTLFLIIATSISLGALAGQMEDGAYLDSRYPLLPHPSAVSILSLAALPSTSNTLELIQQMTPVRSQAKRGTCSIFSATALIEGMLVIAKGQDQNQLDLSEEWLEYLIEREQNDEGSTSAKNFMAMKTWGMTSETALPYIGESWESLDSSTLAKERCGKVPELQQKSCLLAHRAPQLLILNDNVLSNPRSLYYDPEFLNARRAAQEMKGKFLEKYTGAWINEQDQAKALLASGQPIILDIDFYYGAWNHRKADEFKIGRDLGAWARGEVGYPEPGSADRKISLQHPTGHSIVIVGYDDNVEINTQVLMQDGSRRSFTYKGVYYFKNSWGTQNFGTEFQVGGKSLPGYGMITQKYAHEQGAFYRMDLK